jgi:uncharacterized membrane protein
MIIEALKRRKGIIVASLVLGLITAIVNFLGWSYLISVLILLLIIGIPIGLVAITYSDLWK